MQASVKAVSIGSRLFRPTKQAMNITEKAASHIKQLLRGKE